MPQSEYLACTGDTQHRLDTLEEAQAVVGVKVILQRDHSPPRYLSCRDESEWERWVMIWLKHREANSCE